MISIKKSFKHNNINFKMMDEEIIQLHENLNKKYISRSKKFMAGGLVAGCCAISLGVSSILYHAYCSPENINQYIDGVLRAGFYATAYSFFGGIFLGIRNTRKLVNAPKELSNLIQKNKNLLENL